LCGETYTNSNGNADAYLIRLNKNGDTLWTKHLGGALDERFNSVCFLGNRIYAVGKNLTHATDSISDAWIVKLDTNGNFISEGFINGPLRHGEAFNGIMAYDANTFFICGEDNLVDSNSTMSIILRSDTNLNFFIGPYYGGLTSAGEYVSFNQVIKTSYGNICTMGTSKGGLGGMNVFMVGFHADLSWITNFAHNSGLTQDEYGYGAVYGSDGRVMMVGKAEQMCGANPDLGLEDVFLVRFNSDSIDNTKINKSKTFCFADTLFLWVASQHNYDREVSLNLFPNPVTENASLQINCSEQKTFTVRVYSVLGEEIQKFNVVSNSENKVELSTLPNGSYYLKVQDSNGKNISALKFIISK